MSDQAPPHEDDILAGSFTFNDLGLCCCGCPEMLVEYIRKMLLRVHERDFGTYEDLPYMFFVNWADDKGLINHGTTVRCGWLTDKGRKFLAETESPAGEKNQ